MLAHERGVVGRVAQWRLWRERQEQIEQPLLGRFPRLFADLGLAWNDAEDLEASSAIDGYGFGVRLLVPFVDVIRIDVAWGEPGHGASAYFGVSLKATRQRQRVR